MYNIHVRSLLYKILLLALLVVPLCLAESPSGARVAHAMSLPAQPGAASAPLSPMPLEPAPPAGGGMQQAELSPAEAEAGNAPLPKASLDPAPQSSPTAWRARPLRLSARFLPLPALLLAARAPFAEGLHARPPPYF